MIELNEFLLFFFYIVGEHIHIIETQGTFKLISSYGKLMEMFIPKKKYSSQLSCISSDKKIKI